jgi:hypothetical protein
MSMRDAEEMAACRKNLPDYLIILKEKGFYPD